MYTWTTSLDADHKLVGRIWSTKTKEFVDTNHVFAALAEYDVVLLGERHDHPDHHQLQAIILEKVGQSAFVGFEMLDEKDALRLTAGMSPDQVATATEWAESGWPSFELYRPIFNVVKRLNMTPLAIHPARNRLMNRARQPEKFANENAEYLARLSKQGIANLQVDIDRGHCGNAAGAMIDMMVGAQVFKDHWMASQISSVLNQQVDESTRRRRGVIIAGNGHVRKDYGLPNHLQLKTLSIGLIEVQKNQEKIADYAPERFDYVWFTPRLDDEDPCEKYKKALEKMKEKYRKMRLNKRGVSQFQTTPKSRSCQGDASKKSTMSAYSPPSVEREMRCADPATP